MFLPFAPSHYFTLGSLSLQFKSDAYYNRGNEKGRLAQASHRYNIRSDPRLGVSASFSRKQRPRPDLWSIPSGNVVAAKHGKNLENSCYLASSNIPCR